MEQPPPPPSSTAVAAAAVASAPHLNYADSVGSSPRSRNTDSWDDQLLPAATGGGKLRLMCSYGGHIIPRPHDKSLCYVGGETRIIVSDRLTSLSDLSNRLSKTLLAGRSFTLKYQLPNEDLDSLISVTTDEDLENMIEEYDRLTTAAITAAAGKSNRIRVFLFPSQPDSASSIGSLLENSTKSEDWFLNALNGSNRGFSESSSLNCLLGLDDDVAIAGNGSSETKDVEAQIESFGNVKKSAQDVHSVPDSPMMETRSSFGSTSSSPSLVNLPPIRVHVEDQKGMVGGIDEQFAQMSVGNALQKQENGGFVGLSSPPPILPTAAATAVSGLPVGSAVASGEYSNRVFSDDERSEQGIPVAYRKQQPPQAQPQPPQSQPKPTGGFDLPSPDSVSSDGSLTNPLSRHIPMIYHQDQLVQMSSGNNRVPINPNDPNFSDPNSRVVQLQQQVQDFGGYVYPTQFEQHQQLNPQQQQQQQQQQPPPPQNQEQQQQQQQFVQTGPHYIHHHPSGAVPIASYYPMYPPQQHQQYPFYYVSARPNQAYNVPMQQSNYADSPSTRPQTPPPPSMVPNPGAYNPSRNANIPQSEVTGGGVYRTANMAAPPQSVQVPSSQYQPQYVGYSQIQHPSQSIAPNSTVSANYAYDYSDQAHTQMYYTQPLQPQMAAQYQTMTAASAAALPETASSQLPTDNMKQQIRTAQP